ncbi:cytochrome P450 [Ectobacillus ponti]|uniref:Cytochrome P450 n=1 Tax=Ectobacillus ponti TaxID=2961894 RepID=A0AA41X3J1_9BACI|nr:cytochrome P450 [Ectobacillus ponti]MCP8968077.1 cytochrome P450 [Ectobacillus ponti]
MNKENMPGFQLTNYLTFRKDPLAFLYDTHTIADIVTINPSDRLASYIIHAPEAIKEILTVKDEQFVKGSSAKIFSRTLGEGVLTTEGETHRRQRKMVQPAFHKKRIAGYADAVTAYADELVQSWQDGEVRWMNQDMMQLTLRVIVKTMFGTDIQGRTTEIAQAVNDIIEKAADSIMMPIRLFDWLPTKKNRRYEQGVKTLDELTDDLVAEAKPDEDNMMGMLLQARYEDGEPLSRKEIRDQVVTFLIAGHETTANALTWALFLLSQNPEAEQLFHQELDTVLQGRCPTFADIPSLVYTNQIMQETLRLYPPAWIVLREAKEDVEIGGHSFKKNASFMISPYVMHRNPAFFAEPEAFRPERFTKENQANIPHYAYIPFGAGSRGCIGTQFAMMEALLILATVGQRYKLRTLEPEKVRPEPLVSLRVRDGVQMEVVKR